MQFFSHGVAIHAKVVPLRPFSPLYHLDFVKSLLVRCRFRWYGKVWIGHASTPGDWRGKRGEEKMLVSPDLGCLATYLDYQPLSVDLPMLGVASTPPQ
jgi:hypothetical protein